MSRFNTPKPKREDDQSGKVNYIDKQNDRCRKKPPITLPEIPSLKKKPPA